MLAMGFGTAEPVGATLDASVGDSAALDACPPTSTPFVGAVRASSTTVVPSGALGEAHEVLAAGAAVARGAPADGAKTSPNAAPTANAVSTASPTVFLPTPGGAMVSRRAGRGNASFMGGIDGMDARGANATEVSPRPTANPSDSDGIDARPCGMGIGCIGATRMSDIEGRDPRPE